MSINNRYWKNGGIPPKVHMEIIAKFVSVLVKSAQHAPIDVGLVAVVDDVGEFHDRGRSGVISPQWWRGWPVAARLRRGWVTVAAVLAVARCGLRTIRVRGPDRPSRVRPSRWWIWSVSLW